MTNLLILWQIDNVWHIEEKEGWGTKHSNSFSVAQMRTVIVFFFCNERLNDIQGHIGLSKMRQNIFGQGYWE